MERLYSLIILISLLFFVSCTKETKVLVEDNNPPAPGTVPTIKVENFVTKLFIDLLGRTPTVGEKNTEVELLKNAALSFEARELLIRKLQNDSTYNEGDSSYKIAYYNRIYLVTKSRLLEGAEDAEFNQRIGISKFAVNVARLEGDSVAVFRGLEEIERNQNVLNSRIQLRNGEITLNQMYARMLNNFAYDVINMNTFNFINASFDDLYNRFPTKEEYDAAFPIIERSEGGVLFGSYVDNKTEYCNLLTETAEFYEGMVNWTYIQLLGRPANSLELYNRLKEYVAHKDYRELQVKILRSNEYAQF